MQRLTLLVLVLILQTQTVFANDLRTFLKNCAWGTIGGAAVGVASLAFTDKPSESWSNVAKGASLGLYAGIAYGLYQINKEPTTQYQQPDFALFPTLKEGKVESIHVTSTIYEF